MSSKGRVNDLICKKKWWNTPKNVFQMSLKGRVVDSLENVFQMNSKGMVNELISKQKWWTRRKMCFK